MARAGGSRAWARWRRWGFPAAGLAATFGLTLVPGLPFGMRRWPLSGPFGAFTWSAWVVSTSLAVTLLLLAASLRRRGGRAAGGVPAGRMTRGAAGFALLAAAAFGAAARADLIEEYPAAALVLVVAVVLALRGLVRAAAARATTGVSAAARPAPPPVVVDDEDAPDGNPVPRWARVVATGLAVLMSLFVGASLAVRWLGPGLGLVLTTPRATPIFWGEGTFYEYDAVRKAGGDASAFVRAPAPGTTEAARRAVLPAGARLAVKGWLDGGAEVRVEHDPGGKLEGEWGYVRLTDVAE